MKTHVLLLTFLGIAACAVLPGSDHKTTRVEVPPPLVLQSSAYEAAELVQLPGVAPGEFPGLHNVFALSASIISGSEPHGRAALEQIADWGVRTVLSVDGKVPDAETAEELGMRYVHIPIQYNGIDEDELLRISKTFRELEGPFYVHCFHGRHRGPAAAAIGRVVLDGLSREQAIAEMRQWCATASKYEGLYSTVATAELPSDVATAALDYDFPTAHQFDGMRGVMIEMVRKWDLVKSSESRDWEPDPEHPDVVPMQEAVQLHQLYESFAALDEAAAWQDDFRAHLELGRAGAEDLMRALSSIEEDGRSEERVQEAFDAFDRIAESCASCHATYRN